MGGTCSGRSSASTVHCRLQVQRSGTAAKEVALRWSALTRPVAPASGAIVGARVSRAAPRKSHHLLSAELYRSPQHLSNICSSFITSSGMRLLASERCRIASIMQMAKYCRNFRELLLYVKFIANKRHFPSQ